MNNFNYIFRPWPVLSKGFAAGLLAMALSFPFPADAVPAYPGIINHELPDGSILPIRMVGDEHAHRVFTADGYLLCPDEENGFFYATVDANGNIIASTVKAQAPELRSAADNAFLANIDREKISALATKIDCERRESRVQSPLSSVTRKPTSMGMDLLTTSYPSTGSPKSLVVLVEYKDVKFKLDNPKEYFTNMLTEPGFNKDKATGSALDYFTENSQGKFTPEFDVLGPVTLPERRKYYGGNDSMGNDLNPKDMAIHALDILDDEVDFTQYDTDGDGYIDNVYIFYAGRGEADRGGEETVWPHSYDISKYGLKPKYDGVILNHYACSNELSNITNRTDGIGIFVHEFSHVMGLPDLYTTTYNSAFTPAAWSVLDTGSYNNNSHTPPNYGLFERYSLGWIEPQRFSGKATGEYTIKPVENNEGYLVKTENENEFFLIEVRDKSGWDAYIPAAGMLVWYIDYNKSVWTGNTVNNTPDRQRVDIIEADGTQTDNSRNGDCFPGTYSVTSFTATTNPAFVSREGNPVNVEFTQIHRNSDGSVSFTATHDVEEWSGLTGVTNDIDSWTITGRTVSAYAPVEIFTPAGLRLARVNAGDTFEIPAAGIYIVNSSNRTSKITVK